jgi:hypothetical protein
MQTIKEIELKQALNKIQVGIDFFLQFKDEQVQKHYEDICPGLGMNLNAICNLSENAESLIVRKLRGQGIKR